MRLSDGNRADDALGRLTEAWDAEEQRERETRVMKAIAAGVAAHVRPLGRRADGTRTLSKDSPDTDQPPT
jgi:hypothetical protein